MGHEHLSGGITLSDWLGIYGALLSTIIALVASISFFARRRKKIQERAKFQTDLYFLRKTTNDKIVVTIPYSTVEAAMP